MARRADSSLLVLISLAEGPKHGYAMTKDIANFANVTLGAGSLYGAIDRFEADGLIEPCEAEGPRVPYRLTAAGFAFLRADLERIQTVTRIAARRLASS